MNRRIIPLIMCGGAGTRLWPASREVHPKQFLSLFGARSTFQDTLLRVSDADLFERPVIIGSRSTSCTASTDLYFKISRNAKPSPPPRTKTRFGSPLNAANAG